MWNQSILTWPSTLTDINTQANGVLDSVPDNQTSALRALQSTAVRAEFERHPLSNEAEALIGLRGELNTLLTQGQMLSATPYQYGVGDSKSTGTVLSPENAIKTLTTKLNEQSDPHRPKGELYAHVLLLSSHSQADLNDKLITFLSVFSIDEWAQAQRQMQSEMGLSQSQMVKNASITAPRLKPSQWLNPEPLPLALNLHGEQIAQLESLASDGTSVNDKLARLANKRAVRLNHVKSEIAKLSQISGQVWNFSATGSASVIANKLKNSQVPNTGHPYSVATIILSPMPMPFFEELFQ